MRTAPTILEVIGLHETASELDQNRQEANRIIRRALFLKAYELGHTLEDIGKAAGVSRVRVHQVITRKEGKK